MIHIRTIAILGVALSVAGCASQFGQRVTAIVETVKVVASGTVSPEAIYIARNAFDTIEVSATNYLLLPRCPKAAPVCRDPSATKPVIAAMRTGRDARNSATQFLKDHPGALGPQGLYDALVLSTDTIKQLLAQYNARG